MRLASFGEHEAVSGPFRPIDHDTRGVRSKSLGIFDNDMEAALGPSDGRRK